MIKSITEFQGQYRWLSNFWPCTIVMDGLVYPSVEHAYQAAKTLDQQIRLTIKIAHTAGGAKRLGKRLTLRPDWNSVKIDLMYQLVKQKFNDPWLKKLLLETGDAQLIEDNRWGDTFWGVCNGVGQNQLGTILMRVREEIKLHETQFKS